MAQNKTAVGTRPKSSRKHLRVRVAVDEQKPATPDYLTETTRIGVDGVEFVWEKKSHEESAAPAQEPWRVTLMFPDGEVVRGRVEVSPSPSGEEESGRKCMGATFQDLGEEQKKIIEKYLNSGPW